MNDAQRQKLDRLRQEIIEAYHRSRRTQRRRDRRKRSAESARSTGPVAPRG